MNEHDFMDAEYESIRTIFNGRGNNGGQLPGRVMTFIPAERADAVMELDQRIQLAKKYAPHIAGAMVLLAFVVGLLV